MAVIANAMKKSVRLVEMGLKSFASKLKDWFDETAIHCVRNDNHLLTFIKYK
jgi:hypothetical protein